MHFCIQNYLINQQLIDVPILDFKRIAALKNPLITNIEYKSRSRLIHSFKLENSEHNQR